MKGKGSAALKRYQETKMPLTPQQAIKAKCCECMSGWHDGRAGCNIPKCALYPYMPYREKVPEHEPKKRKLKLTEEQRKVISERLQKIRKQQIAARR